jgi:hypothetical protein
MEQKENGPNPFEIMGTMVLVVGVVYCMLRLFMWMASPGTEARNTYNLDASKRAEVVCKEHDGVLGMHVADAQWAAMDPPFPGGHNRITRTFRVQCNDKVFVEFELTQ